MSAYFVLNYTITDQDLYDQYSQAVINLLKPLIDAGHIKIHVLAHQLNDYLVEGKSGSSLVIIEFDSMERLDQFYSSPDYQDIIHLRIDASTGWAALVPEIS